MDFQHKIRTFQQLSDIRQQHLKQVIVHAHGVFDLLHYGHLQHLSSAKQQGDILVITLTPDEYVNKGPHRPHYMQDQRLCMLAALEMVDYVVLNHSTTAIEPITALRPNIYVKGPDYQDRSKDITGGILEEERAVQAVGGVLAFTDDATQSSTYLLNKFFPQWDNQQQQVIDTIKSLYSLDSLTQIIEDISQLSILVIGEPIIDSYVFCEAQGLSSKSPTVSARFLDQEHYAGGSIAIANHLAALGCQVSLLITHDGTEIIEQLKQTALDPKINLHEIIIADYPTPMKTRYITRSHSQKLFELTNLRSDQWEQHNPKPYINKLKQLSAQHDISLIADFGHGLIEGEVLKNISELESFIALNVQTNSSNLGYNPISKHQFYDYLSMDERECRLSEHDRYQPIETVANKSVHHKKLKPTSITLGTAGSLYYDHQGLSHTCPVFFKDVVDTTGAGDAYFAITATLVKNGVEGVLVPFLGNCFAGLKTRIIGNKSPVSKIDLLRTIKAILG